MTQHWRWVWLLCLLPLIALAAPTPIPDLHDPVVDTAQVLSAGQAEQLRAQALDLQARRGAQLQVLVIDSAGDEGIEAYAQRVFDQWQIGRKGVDDGVLLLLAMGDRRVRIQTGYGLEGAIPDAYAQRIIDHAIIPRLREGEPGQGIIDGSALLVGLIDGEALPLPAETDNVVRLPQEWRRGDSIVALSMLAGFVLGLWPLRRTPGAAPRAAWRRPMEVTALVLVGALACAVFTPGATLALLLVMALLVPVTTLLGWAWRRSRVLRWMLVYLLVGCAVASSASVWMGRPVPSLALHMVLVVVLCVVAMLVSFLVLALRNSWRAGRVGFCVRLVILLALTGMFAWLVPRIHAQAGNDGGTVFTIVGSFVLYIAWTLVMALHQSAQARRANKGRRRSRRYDRDSDSRSSSSSSSSSSSWSGGGGRSGGGGASGSW
ncbi:TPM domain-containing protein [Bacillus subtilis subsp. subtilis]|nr:TPM domain-containing protein [Bacillus subtilis subsp. subtilis]